MSYTLKQSLRHLSITGLMCAGLLANVAAADTGTWPKEQPIRLIVPFAPGGATDTMGRLIANELSNHLKQSVVVENRSGGGGNIGSNLVAKAGPDGYTLLFGAAGNITINPSLFDNMPYSAERDLSPVALVSQSMNVLVVPASLPVNSVSEFVDYAKKNADTLNHGSSGNGGTSHLAGELFNTMAGMKITHVPYQGSGPAMIDLLAGRVHVMFDNLPSALPHIHSGKLKALGVTGLTRSDELPDVPTIDETGLKGFEATTWFGIFAPTGTPEAIQERLNSLVNTIMQEPKNQEKLKSMAAYVKPTSREEFAELIKRDTEKWARVIKIAGISLE